MADETLATEAEATLESEEKKEKGERERGQTESPTGFERDGRLEELKSSRGSSRGEGGGASNRSNASRSDAGDGTVKGKRGGDARQNFEVRGMNFE